MYFLICVLILMIPIWLIYLSLRCRLYIINIPMPRCSLFFGHALEFLDKKSILSKFTKYCIEYGGIYKIYIPPKLPSLIISDPELIQQLATTHLEKSLDYRFFKRWIGQGLLTADVKFWKPNRRLLTPCFGRLSVLMGFVNIFEMNGNDLVNHLENQIKDTSIDVFPLIKMRTLNSMCETSMGVSKLNPDYMQKYCQSMQKLLKIYVNRSSSIKRFDFLYRLSNDYIEEEKALKVVSKVFKMIMKEKMSDNAENKVDENNNLSFLDMLLEIQTKHDLSKDYIRDEVNTFLLGGHDTTATAIAFTLYALARNPDIQDKVLAEQISLFGSSKKDSKVSYPELKQMKYLELVIKESLRMFPPIPAIGRRITSDFKLGDYELPKNINVTVFIYGCHHNPKYFPEPEKFIPERFLDCITPSSFIPFSFGPRNCIGNKFAMLQMKSCVSKVVRRFRLLPPKPDYDMNLIATATLFSENGIRLSLEKRGSSE